MKAYRKFIAITRSSLSEFFSDLPLMHSAALAYYTLLAMVPLIYMSISIFGHLIGQDMILDVIASVLQEQVGIADVSGIMDFLGDVDLTKSSFVLQLTGGIAIILSTTAILNSLKKSINQFYGVKKKRAGARLIILGNLLTRVISMAFVLGITILIIMLYFLETILLSLDQQYLEEKMLVHWFVSGLIRHGLPILTNLVVITFIFKYLHDGRIRWGIAIRGAAITSVMLYLGQLLIKFYLMNYFFASGAGIAGTLLVLIVWVYYSAFILFFGVKTTAAYARHVGHPIVSRD